jgi:capsid protein
MGVILDEFGRTARYDRAARGARENRDRPYEPVEKKDITELVPRTDRETILSHARRLFLNFGPVRSAINQRATYAVGRAWGPKFLGSDSEFGTTAKTWLSETFYPIGDSRGGMHDFRTNLYTWSVAIDVDGEVFILLTETANGFPQYQSIPAHRIANPIGMGNGPQRGGILIDGIVYYPSGTPKEYSFIAKDGRSSEWIPAANIIHLYDPEWQLQGRGLSGLTHCINDCRDILQSTEWERLAMMQMSSISMVEYNENGGPDMDDPGNDLMASTAKDGQGITVQSLDGGTVRYFKSNSGGKIETLRNDRPGNPFLEFHDKLLRSAFAGMNWPYAFYSGHSAGGGTAQRTEIMQAQRAIEDRQDLLSYAAKRLVGYAIAKAQKRGDLPQSADWYQWEFNYPAKITIDDGRITKELETLWRIGAVNMSEIVAMRGNSDYSQHVTERAEEIALRKLAKEAIEEKYDVEIEDREMSALNPNEMPEKSNGEPMPDPSDDPSSDPIDPNDPNSDPDSNEDS